MHVLSMCCLCSLVTCCVRSKENVLKSLAQTWRLQLDRLLKKYVVKMQTWFRRKRQERLEREDAR